MPKRTLPDNEVLRDLYESGLSAREIADRLNVNKHTVASALKRIGITRTSAETAKIQFAKGRRKPVAYWTGKKQPPEMVEKRIEKIRGEKHWLWNGGKGKREYRQVIQKEICLSCGTSENLAIHHIDFDHYNNAEENLAVLCVSCHLSLHKQLYWDAVHAGKSPKKSNAPIGWKRK